MSRVFKSRDVILDDSEVTILHKSNNLNKAAEMAKKEPEIKQETKQETKEEVKQEVKQEKISTDITDRLIKAANEQAELIILNAKKLAEGFIADAKEEAKEEILKLKQESQEEGLKKGYQEGLEKSKELKEEALKMQEEAMLKQKETIKESEPAMVSLITKVCEKILKDSLFLEPTLIVNLIRQGLNETSLNGDLTVRVSPDFYDVVVKNKDELLKLVDSSNSLDIAKDLSLKGADCIIETQLGNVDCSLDEQLKILKHNLYLILENR